MVKFFYFLGNPCLEEGNHKIFFSEDDIDAMFKTADSDKDDLINYEEFYKMIIPSKPTVTVRPSRAEFIEYYKKF